MIKECSVNFISCSDDIPAIFSFLQLLTEFTGEVNIETPSTVVSMNPASPSKASSSSAAPAAPNRGMGYSPLQNQFSTEANAPVVMSPVDFDSPGPSPAYVGGPPGTQQRSGGYGPPQGMNPPPFAEPQPFGDPQPFANPSSMQRPGSGGVSYYPIY